MTITTRYSSSRATASSSVKLRLTVYKNKPKSGPKQQQCSRNVTQLMFTASLQVVSELSRSEENTI